MTAATTVVSVSYKLRPLLLLLMMMLLLLLLLLLLMLLLLPLLLLLMLLLRSLAVAILSGALVLGERGVQHEHHLKHETTHQEGSKVNKFEGQGGRDACMRELAVYLATQRYCIFRVIQHGGRLDVCPSAK